MAAGSAKRGSGAMGESEQPDLDSILASHANSIKAVVQAELDSRFASFDAKFTTETHTLLKNYDNLQTRKFSAIEQQIMLMREGMSRLEDENRRRIQEIQNEILEEKHALFVGRGISWSRK